jgi:hypothetical protein
MAAATAPILAGVVAPHGQNGQTGSGNTGGGGRRLGRGWEERQRGNDVERLVSEGEREGGIGGGGGPVVKMEGQRWGSVQWGKRREALGTRAGGRARGQRDRAAVATAHVVVLHGEEIGDGKGADKWAFWRSILV